jgi:hypothetical protein
MPPTTEIDILVTDLQKQRKQKGVVVFSGGSAANSLVDVFNGIVEENRCQLTYVIPISDNGGSSSELIRVFGGPGMRNAIITPIITINKDPELTLIHLQVSETFEVGDCNTI